MRGDIDDSRRLYSKRHSSDHAQLPFENDSREWEVLGGSRTMFKPFNKPLLASLRYRTEYATEREQTSRMHYDADSRKHCSEEQVEPNNSDFDSLFDLKLSVPHNPSQRVQRHAPEKHENQHAQHQSRLIQATKIQQPPSRSLPSTSPHNSIRRNRSRLESESNVSEETCARITSTTPTAPNAPKTAIVPPRAETTGETMRSIGETRLVYSMTNRAVGLTNSPYGSAVRLNARRCMLSFFDRKKCYIMAEASRTLSLQTGTVLDPKDDPTAGPDSKGDVYGYDL
ncbi:uncharacterized protein BDZ99DRAFT_514144 [Mytilinidion resinicola]|uniref:Uncharacterized protein n=1 Tax=Mytilinidion resinicola TaxID=574789 RepID=A0A6A6Z9X4_9PEZI|nr:uncharacterized protein BDZ99DRAFT_514144 [Mytilinidion resinicola]KAF2817921.1 hypothetical protein BDZ99DRAFT_514144 [Mytilinidion resinicola]